MKQQMSFFVSLEKYAWRVVGKSPLPWLYVGVGVVLASLLASMVNARYSTVGARSQREVVEWAARAGDYETARTLYVQCQVTPSYAEASAGRQCHGRVLGAETEIESLVYPERVVENKIIETEELLTQYPGHRDILVELARLYGELDGMRANNNSPLQGGRGKPRPYGDIAREYWEQARILDPNNEMFEGTKVPNTR